MKLLRLALLTAGVYALTAASKPVEPAYVTKVPITDGTLGSFPYFTIPGGDQPQNPPVSHEDGHFYFWTGKTFRNVEGRSYLLTFMASGNASFDAYGARHAFTRAVVAIGAKRIAGGKVPNALILALPLADRQDLTPGMGDLYNDPVETWLIRRPDHQIWISFTSNSAQASLAVVETAVKNNGSS